jgi:L-rhamnose mutarotase
MLNTFPDPKIPKQRLLKALQNFGPRLYQIHLDKNHLYQIITVTFKSHPYSDTLQDIQQSWKPYKNAIQASHGSTYKN